MYWLSDEISFPHHQYASPEGLLAVGGDLSAERLLFAYENGIFPWYNADEPILWWSPDPRFVLFPHQIKISKSMRQVIRKNRFTVSFDKAFDAVIKNCSVAPRIGQEGTWLTDEMIEAYTFLHELGFAHSVETWENGLLVGGLYGIALGKCFFGESMFAKTSNASKFALIAMAKTLEKLDFELIDCQSETTHLRSMGADFITRDSFLKILEKNKLEETLQGSWASLSTPRLI